MSPSPKKKKHNVAFGRTTTETGEAETYEEQLGRWEREALVDVDDEVHWYTMKIAHTARGPIMHMANFLQKEIFLPR